METDQEFNKINQPNKPVLVDFYTNNCWHCEAMEPVINELEKRLGNKVSFLRINAQQHPQIPKAFYVNSVPALILFRNGKIVWKQPGLSSVHDLEKTLKPFLDQQ